MLSAYRLKSFWKRTTAILSVFVIFFTIGALVMPGITLSTPTCGKAEHTHDDTCYIDSAEKVLACSSEDASTHTHTDECYKDSEKVLSCSVEEHKHTDSCYPNSCEECGGIDEHTDDCSFAAIKNSNTSETVLCDCGSTEDIHLHQDTCTRKTYIGTLVTDKTPEKIYENWASYDESIQNDILCLLQTENTDSYNKLLYLINPTDYNEPTVLSDGTEICSDENSDVQAVETSADKQNAILSGMKISESEDNALYFIDLNSESNGASMKVSKLLKNNLNSRVIVIHLLDTEKAVEEAINTGNNNYFVTEEPEVFAEEIAAGKTHSGVSENRIYYTLEVQKPNANGDITFETESFSTFIFYVVFEYNGLEFKLDGGNDVDIDTLLESLGENYTSDEITDISSSDPELISVYKSGKQWRIKAEKSFATTEWLYITLSNDEVLEIRMVDPIIYSYLRDTGTYADMGTTIGYSHGDYSTTNVTNTTCVLGDIINYSTSSTAYMEDVDVFVRPGMSVKFTRWLKGMAAVSDLQFNWTGFGCQGYSADNNHIDAYHFNILEIPEDITEVKTYQYEFATYVPTAANATTYKVTKIHLHVIPDNPEPQKLSTVLENNPDLDLEIKEIPVTLYNFDGYQYNKTNSVRQFRSSSLGQSPTASGVTVNNSVINSGGTYATMGILQNQLDSNGLPVWTFGENVDLFGYTNTAYRTTYNDVGFEFVYDDNDKYYTYSSTLNHAQYNQETNKIELYRESMASNQIISASPESGAYSRGGFYPFGDISKAFINPTPIIYSSYSQTTINDYAKYTAYDPANYDLNAWKSALSTAGEFHRAYLAQQTMVTPAANSKLDMHFGIQLKNSFYLPESRQITTKDGDKVDLFYEFSGDDDVWVFIDGKLVLDIGGGHTPVHGTIDFRTGQIYVQSAREAISETELSSIQTPYTTISQDILDLEENRMHTIQVFYLETHSGVSNCYMRFNLPIVSGDDNVIVSKEVAAENGNQLSVIPNEDYRFRLEVSKDGGAFIPTTEYKCLNVNDNQEISPDEQGYYTLKNGEALQFLGIMRFDDGATTGTLPTRVRIVEVAHSPPYTIAKTEVNGVEVPPDETGYVVSSPQEIADNGSNLQFHFKNYFKTESLKIEKKLTGKGLDLIDPDQLFHFELIFDTDSSNGFETADIPVLYNDSSSDTLPLGSDYKLDIALKKDETILLENIPVGLSYILKEIHPHLPGINFNLPNFTSSVNGIELDSQTIGFGSVYSSTVMSGGENKITVLNTTLGDYPLLPETGGMGNYLYSISGLLLLSTAVIALIRKYKKPRKEDP